MHRMAGLGFEGRGHRVCRVLGFCVEGSRIGLLGFGALQVLVSAGV